MKRKTDVWDLQQTMFLAWNQLRGTYLRSYM